MKDLADMMIYAFRYALGRKTYAVATVATFLIEHKGELEEYAKGKLIREIEEAIEECRAGMEMDELRWRSVVKELSK